MKRYVECINVDCLAKSHLILNKEYEVLNEDSHYYYILNDNNIPGWHLKNRFSEPYTKQENMKNLTIDMDKVLKAANECPEAKKTLQILFPELFEKEIIINILNQTKKVINIRSGGEYASKSLFLPTDAKIKGWEVKIDELANYCLIPILV